MLIKKVVVAASFFLATAGAWGQAVPEHFTVAGGFNPIPLLIKAGEEFVGKMPQYKPPQILWNDTTVGFELFCAGSGVDTPSINSGTRQMTPAERERCRKNGVNDIIQFKLGHNALAVARSGDNPLAHLTRKELLLAVAKEVPDPRDKTKLIPNPYRNWKDINPELPNLKIRVLGPKPEVGLFQTFATGILMAGCQQVEELQALKAKDAKRFEEICKSTRGDGAYGEYAKTPEAIEALKNDVGSIGVVSLTISAKEGLKNVSLGNLEPNPVAISRDMYDLAFPMLVSVKKSHVGVVPGLKEYLAELTSEAAMNNTGYFYKMGVIPLPRDERKVVRADLQALKVMAD